MTPVYRSNWRAAWRAITSAPVMHVLARSSGRADQRGLGRERDDVEHEIGGGDVVGGEGEQRLGVGSVHARAG